MIQMITVFYICKNRGDKMTIWSKFTSWLSGWPESKERKKDVELAYLFEEEKKLERIHKEKKPKGLNPKKKTKNKAKGLIKKAKKK